MTNHQTSADRTSITARAERVLRVVRDLHALGDVYEGTYGQCCEQYHDDVKAVAEAVKEAESALKLVEFIGQGGVAMPNVASELHRDIMNLDCIAKEHTPGQRFYKLGHKRALHAAAELVVERLQTTLTEEER